MFEQKHIVKLFLFCILFFIFTMTNVSAGDHIETYNAYILKQLNSRTMQAYKQRDYAGGIKNAEETYKYSLTHLGKADPNTLTAINTLIRFYYLNGEDKAAESFFQESLQIRENLLGKIIESTIATSERMSLAYIQQGRYEEAKAVLKKDLNLMEAVLGKNSPASLNILHNLGLLSFYQGDYKEAESIFKNLLHASRSLLGYSHQDTLATQLNYTLLDIYMGNKESALQLIKETEKSLFSQDLQDLDFTSEDRISQLFIKNVSDFQNIAFIFASKYPESEYINYAVNIGMNAKQIYTEIYGLQKISVQELSKISESDQLKDKFNNSIPSQKF
jgi:tetratricopeptide (TPR) repeat protein